MVFPKSLLVRIPTRGRGSNQTRVLSRMGLNISGKSEWLMTSRKQIKNYFGEHCNTSAVSILFTSWNTNCRKKNIKQLWFAGMTWFVDNDESDDSDSWDWIGGTMMKTMATMINKVWFVMLNLDQFVVKLLIRCEWSSHVTAYFH